MSLVSGIDIRGYLHTHSMSILNISLLVGGHDQAQSESWAFDLTAQCLATSAKTPNLSHRYLLAALWDACASLLNDVATRSASIDKFFILHGILRAFSDARFHAEFSGVPRAQRVK